VPAAVNSIRAVACAVSRPRRGPVVSAVSKLVDVQAGHRHASGAQLGPLVRAR
jgi:hypothetical protein